MAEMSTEHLRIIRSKVGDKIEQERIQRSWDQFQSIPLVVVELLEERLAILTQQPDSVSIEGALSVSQGGVLQALREMIRAAKEEAAGDPDTGLMKVGFSKMVRRNPR